MQSASEEAMEVGQEEPGEDIASVVSAVLHDMCEKVVAELEQEPAEQNTESDEFASLDNSPDVDIDIERDNDTPSVENNSREQTLEMQNSDSEPEGDKPKKPCESLSYELEQGSRILREIMSEANKSVNWPFMEAVDADKMGLYDYYDRIKKPMWLKKSE